MAKQPEAIDYQFVRPEDVSFSFAIDLQRIGYDSWCHELPSRDPGEIRTVFNYRDQSHIAKKQAEYRKLASRSGLVVAKTVERHPVTVGYVAVKKDISGGAAERLVKTLFKPGRVYANITGVAVEPALRDFTNTIGVNLVDRAMDTFSRSQTPTTYIYEEDGSSKVFYESMGFIKTPEDQIPEPSYEYFGYESPPVHTMRYAAPSVGELQHTIGVLTQ